MPIDCVGDALRALGFNPTEAEVMVRVTLATYRFIGLSVFGSRNQAKDHGLRTVQRSCAPDLTSL